MTNDNDSDISSPIALAEPPEPPSGPPKAPAATGEAPGPDRRRIGIIGLASIVILALVLLCAVLWLVLSQTRTAPLDSHATQNAFESAMRKANVKAVYPAKPVDLSSVRPTGSHSFEATFTADEIASLINTFHFTSNVGGTQIELRSVQMQFLGPDLVHARAGLMANGGTYSGDVTLDVRFEMGRFKSGGATELNVEGVTGSAAQRGLVTDALVNYANDYLKNALGLTVVSVQISADGVRVVGMAPDAIAYQ